MSENTRIGISWKLSDYDLLEPMGFDFMDAFGWDLMALSDEDFDSLAQSVRKGRLKCANICLYCTNELQFMGPHYDAEKVRAYARKAAGRCHELNMGGIGIGSGASRTVPPGYSRQKAEEQLAEAMTITAEECKKHGLALMLEPLNEKCCNHMLTTREAAEFIDRLDLPNVSMVFDFHHAMIMGETLADFAHYVPYMRSVQFNEIDFTSGEKLFLREENFDLYLGWLRGIRQAGYKGDFCIEPTTTKNLEADLKQSLDIAKRLKNALEYNMV